MNHTIDYNFAGDSKNPFIEDLYPTPTWWCCPKNDWIMKQVSDAHQAKDIGTLHFHLWRTLLKNSNEEEE